MSVYIPNTGFESRETLGVAISIPEIRTPVADAADNLPLIPQGGINEISANTDHSLTEIDEQGNNHHVGFRNTRLAASAAMLASFLGIMAPSVARGEEVPSTTPASIEEPQPQPTSPVYPDSSVVLPTPPSYPSANAASATEPAAPVAEQPAPATNLLSTANYPFATFGEIQSDFEAAKLNYPNIKYETSFKAFYNATGIEASCGRLENVSQVKYKSNGKGAVVMNMQVKNAYFTGQLAYIDNGTGKYESVKYTIPCDQLVNYKLQGLFVSIGAVKGKKQWVKSPRTKAVPVKLERTAAKFNRLAASPEENEVITKNYTATIKFPKGIKISDRKKGKFVPALSSEMTFKKDRVPESLLRRNVTGERYTSVLGYIKKVKQPLRYVNVNYAGGNANGSLDIAAIDIKK